MNIGTAKYGMPALASPATVTVGAGASNGAVTTPRQGVVGRLSLENPMTWLLVIGFGSLGLIAVSTNARVGPLRVGASVGK